MVIFAELGMQFAPRLLYALGSYLLSNKDDVLVSPGDTTRNQPTICTTRKRYLSALNQDTDSTVN